MDNHDAQALAHYQTLIAQFYPPDLATALAAARYQVGLGGVTIELPALLNKVAEQRPDLKRAIGHTVAAVEGRRTKIS